MKILFFSLVLLLSLIFSGCDAQHVPETTVPDSSAAISSEGGTWVDLDGASGYRDGQGNLVTGWQTIDGERYRFSPEGILLTGWTQDVGQRYYLNPTGKMCTGWQQIDNKRFFFREDGTMLTGWAPMEEGTHYFGVDGAMITGLMNIEGQGYYFGTDGLLTTGWLELDGNTYYFGTDGVMATGKVEIEGTVHYFSPHGIRVVLVNPWNMIPEDYSVELVNVTDEYRVSAQCSEALEQMLADCEAAGFEPYIVSAYRTQADQEFLFNRKINTLMDQGWSRENAEIEAAKNVAIPGTSEHQLGLAVDIIGSEYPYLDEYQATTATQQWLMENCCRYGFILRYPNGTTDRTGIVFEPWHYRYVGIEMAREITNLGITLEEYLGAA